jgi:predicted nuclease of predicted toxin-antitoxin system
VTVWIDAQLSPSLATWISEELAIEAVALCSLGLWDPRDQEIFVALLAERRSLFPDW